MTLENTAAVFLTPEERERYSRQILFWGEEKQLLLKGKKILVIGAGGLGSPVLYYLASAGVGELAICDFDAVVLSNLNRQILHNLERMGVNKAESARRTLSALNPNVTVSRFSQKLTPEELVSLAERRDLVLDMTDSMEHKESVSPLLVEKGIPAIYGVLLGMGGFCFLSDRGGPCWHCLFKKAPVYPGGRALPMEYYPSLGAAAGFLGSFIAEMAIRFLLGNREPLSNKVFYTAQRFPSKKLALCFRGVKAVMTEHLKKAFEDGKNEFPEGKYFFNENAVEMNKHCEVCGKGVENGAMDMGGDDEKIIIE